MNVDNKDPENTSVTGSLVTYGLYMVQKTEIQVRDHIV